MPWGCLGRSWGCVGDVRGGNNLRKALYFTPCFLYLGFGVILVVSLAASGPSLALWGLSWAVLGLSWAVLGAVLGLSWGCIWPSWGRLGLY